ncbi:MAG: hypothetical protein WCK51_13340 [Armatimonadota bacterium]
MKLTSKQTKLAAGLVLLGGALAFGMGPSPATPVATKVKKGAKTADTVGLLAITHPSDEKHYGEGTYVFEGQIGKGKKVEVRLDERDPVQMSADSDGAYRFEAKKVKEGAHSIEVIVKDAGKSDSKPETQSLEFTVSKDAPKEIVAHSSPKGSAKVSPKVAKNDAHKDSDELPIDLLPEDDGSDVVYPGSSDLGTDDVAKKDKVVAEEAKGKPAAKPHEKPKALGGKKPAPKKPAPTKPVSKFAISSHSNFNVVPHGVIKIGGKGTPGDKVMLLVDGKPSMRGTVKADGRWSFPVKVAKPGFRKITAQNLKTRQQAWIKLKIK